MAAEKNAAYKRALCLWVWLLKSGNVLARRGQLAAVSAPEPFFLSHLLNPPRRHTLHFSTAALLNIDKMMHDGNSWLFGFKSCNLFAQKPLKKFHLTHVIEILYIIYTLYSVILCLFGRKQQKKSSLSLNKKSLWRARKSSQLRSLKSWFHLPIKWIIYSWYGTNSTCAGWGWYGCRMTMLSSKNLQPVEMVGVRKIKGQED